MKNLVIAFLFMNYFISADLANAGCSDFRMDRGPDNGAHEGSMVHVPVRSQGGYPNCHSFTAASLIDAFRYTHGERDFQSHSSPTDLVYAGLTQTPTPNLQSGVGAGDPGADIRGAVALGGTCTLPQLHEERDIAGAGRFMSGLHQLRADAQSNQCRLNNMSHVQDRHIVLTRQFLAESGFGSEVIPSDSIINAFLSANAQNRFQQYSALIHSLCRRSVHPLPRFELVEIPFGSLTSANRVAWINSVFDNTDEGTPRQPIAIAYCASILNNPSYIGDLSSADCGAHASAIIGRRMRGGQCEFLLHNSWGTSCDGYPSGACEGGKIWVNAEAVSRSTDRITYLR